MIEYEKKILDCIDNWIIKRGELSIPSSPTYGDVEVICEFLSRNYSVINERGGPKNAFSNLPNWTVQKKKGEKPIKINIQDMMEIFFMLEKFYGHNFFLNDNKNKYDYLSYNANYLTSIKK